MIGQALDNLRPGAVWICRGGTYAGLEWLDDNQTKPTAKQVADEVSRLASLPSQPTEVEALTAVLLKKGVITQEEIESEKAVVEVNEKK